MSEVLVVGSANGIGRATVDSLLADGLNVVGLDKEESAIQDHSYKHVSCDVGDYSALEDTCIALDEFDISHLVYCAGEQYIFPAAKPDMNAVERMLRVNAIAPVAHYNNAPA